MKLRKTQRQLTPMDLKILKFLWRWKVSNTPTLKTFLEPNTPFFTFYNRIKRLRKEGHIQLGGDSEVYRPRVWFLTKKGFETAEFDLGEPSEKRFLPQSIPHDAWVLAFQLGHFVHGIPSGVALCTEQQFRCFDLSLLPAWIPGSKKHVPDGFTFVSDGKKKTVYGIEVELNLKPIERYDEVSGYYDGQIKVDHVLWLVSSENMMKRIKERFKATETIRPSIHNFILLEDFKKIGWSSRILDGDLKDLSVHQLMSVTSQSHGGHRPVTTKPQQPIDIFLSTGRSPRVLAR